MSEGKCLRNFEYIKLPSLNWCKYKCTFYDVCKYRKNNKQIEELSDFAKLVKWVIDWFIGKFFKE